MQKIILSGMISLVIGFVVGYLIFSGPQTPAQMASMQNMESMPHPMLEVDSSLPVPSVSLEAISDSKDGYNLHITTTNYTFTPEKVGESPTQNEGHAHLYVNGVKIARLYGPWFNISNSVLKDGENTVEVTLNANDHSEWMQNGTHISDIITITKTASTMMH